MGKIKNWEHISKTLEIFFTDILEKFQGKYNTPETRRKLKNKFDNVCDFFKEGGLIDDFSVCCDETNNAPYTIDMGLGVVDTSILYEGMRFTIQSIISYHNGHITTTTNCSGQYEELQNLDRFDKLEEILDENNK